MKNSESPRDAAQGGRSGKKKIIDDFISEVMGNLRRLECAACGQVNAFDHYMVLSSVWKLAGLKRRDFCCLDCLETRLGRKLRINDFDPKIPLNRPLVFGYLMGLDASKNKGGKITALPGLPRRKKRSSVNGLLSNGTGA